MYESFKQKKTKKPKATKRQSKKRISIICHMSKR